MPANQAQVVDFLLIGGGLASATAAEILRAAGADLLAFPEMVIPGYMPEDLLLKPSFIERSIDMLVGVLAVQKDGTRIDQVATRVTLP